METLFKTVGSRSDGETEGKPEITRLLHPVRERNWHAQGSLEKELATTISKAWCANEKWTSDTTLPTSQPPTRSSGSWYDASTSARYDRLPVQAPSPLRHDTLYDPIAHAKKERRRRRAEILDMPLPNIPQELRELPESATQKECPQSSVKPVQCT
ncbi:hypothetical protein PM082_024986 [Marasmius tenuissimus]|nr:hypothetical protein PM082_024986 [Marasmius tenuissimus]